MRWLKERYCPTEGQAYHFSGVEYLREENVVINCNADFVQLPDVFFRGCLLLFIELLYKPHW